MRVTASYNADNDLTRKRIKLSKSKKRKQDTKDFEQELNKANAATKKSVDIRI